MMWHNESLNESALSSNHRNELPYGHVMPYTFYLWYLQPPLGLVILFVNSLTITAVCRFSFLHSASNILIANLAFADLLLAVLAMPINWTLMYFEIEAHKCYIPICLSLLPLVSSLYFLVAIAIERSLCIIKPFFYQKHATTKNVIFVSISTWVVSVFSCFIHVLNPKVTVEGKCGPDRVLSAEFSLISAVAFLIIVIILVTLYGSISCVARKQSRRIAFQTRCQEIKKRSDAKVRRMMMTVLGVFFICWTPYVIVMVMIYYFHNNPLWLMVVREVTELLAFSNSIMNPIIYAFCNKHFSFAFRSLLRMNKKGSRRDTVVRNISIIDTQSAVISFELT